MSEKRVEASCLRCYVWGDDLDLNAIADALADALVEQGFGGSDGDMKALVVVTPDTLPLDGEELVRAVEDLNAGLVVIPQESAPHE